MTEKNNDIHDYLAMLSEVDLTAPIGDPAAPGRDQPTHQIPVGHVSPLRIAEVFADSQQERERIGIAFRRMLTDAHLTLEVRIILNEQFGKVLRAATHGEQKFMHLKMLLGKSEGENVEGRDITEAMSPQASNVLMRLSRILSPDHATMVRNALSLIGQNKPIDVRRVRTIVEAFEVMLAMFAEHPELLNTIAAKSRDVGTMDDLAPTGQRSLSGAPAV